MDRRKLISDFEKVLREDDTLSASDREIILRNYEQALESTPVQLGPPNLKELQADFAETVNRLAEMQVIDKSESAQLVRDLTDALKPLEEGSVQQSEEYLRRVGEDGIESATQWLAGSTGAEPMSSAGAFRVGGTKSTSTGAVSANRRRKR